MQVMENSPQKAENPILLSLDVCVCCLAAAPGLLLLRVVVVVADHPGGAGALAGRETDLNMPDSLTGIQPGALLDPAHQCVTASSLLVQSKHAVTFILIPGLKHETFSLPAAPSSDVLSVKPSLRHLAGIPCIDVAG